MERARLLELFGAHFDQRLSEVERAELSSELAHSRDSCRLFWEYAQQHAMLAELIAEARGLQLAEQEQCVTCARVPDEPTRKGALRRATWFVAALAAALLLSLGLGWLFQANPQHSSEGPILAKLGDFQGEVHILAELGLFPARAGMHLRPGEEVRTGQNSSAVVTFDDNSHLELNADTAVRLGEVGQGKHSKPGKQVFLKHGVLNANVKEQPANQPLRFSTDEADLLVPGSRFSAAGILGETRIEVEEGKALLARKGDVKSIEVFSGTYAISSPDMEVFAPETRVPTSTKPIATLEENAGPVLALAPVGNDQVAVGCWNGQVKLWDIHTRQVQATLDADRPRVHSLATSADGKWLVAGYDSVRQKREPALFVWDLERQQIRQSLPCLTKVPAVGFMPDAETVALISHNHPQRGILIWDLGDRRERLQLGERLERPECLALSPDGRIVAAGYRDGVIRLWDTLTGRIERLFEGHKREVQSLAFQPGGDLLVSGSRDGTVRIWSLDTGAQKRVLTGTFNEVRCLAFSPDGQTLATGHAGVCVLWNLRTGEKRSSLKAHKFAITSLVYLDQGRILATAGWDRTVKLWMLAPAIDG